MNHVKAVIFDCFGVLYPAYVDKFFHEHNVDADSALIDKLNTQIDLGQISQQEFYSQLGSALHMSGDYIKEEMEAGLKVDEGLVALIRELKNSYKVGLLSNAGEEEIAVIYRDEINTLFDAITVSYEVGDVKPNPQIFRTAAERLNVSVEECVFIDDTLRNLEGARQLGIKTIHYPEFANIPDELRVLLAPLPGQAA